MAFIEKPCPNSVSFAFMLGNLGKREGSERKETSDAKEENPLLRVESFCAQILNGYHMKNVNGE